MNFTVQEIGNVMNALIAIGQTLVTVFAQLSQVALPCFSKFVQALVQIGTQVSGEIVAGPFSSARVSCQIRCGR